MTSEERLKLIKKMRNAYAVFNMDVALGIAEKAIREDCAEIVGGSFEACGNMFYDAGRNAGKIEARDAILASIPKDETK